MVALESRVPNILTALDLRFVHQVEQDKTHNPLLKIFLMRFEQLCRMNDLEFFETPNRNSLPDD